MDLLANQFEEFGKVVPSVEKLVERLVEKLVEKMVGKMVERLVERLAGRILLQGRKSMSKYNHLE